jgi:hypothetical protein
VFAFLDHGYLPATPAGPSGVQTSPMNRQLNGYKRQADTYLYEIITEQIT